MSAIVTLHTVPCFVAGTLIDTPEGDRARSRTLRPAIWSLTLDEGPQPLRWVGGRRLRAEGAQPGRDRSRHFRRPWPALGLAAAPGADARRRAELMFGEPEVLVTARDLVNGDDGAAGGGG